MAELSAELRQLREAGVKDRDALAATREELERLVAQNAEMDAQRRGLQRKLARFEGEPVEPTPPLQALLQSRGLMGQDEFRALFLALAEARQLGGLLPQLLVEDEDRARIFLDDKVVLLGDCGACPSAPGRAVLRVPTPRCEVCGGSDIRRLVRQFVDACLLSGLLKITVVGGSPKYHRQLRDLVDHHRLDLELVNGTVRRNARQARADMDNRDVIVLWGGTLLDHSISDLYDNSGRARLVRIPHRGIGGMLAQAARWLNADDPT